MRYTENIVIIFSVYGRIYAVFPAHLKIFGPGRKVGYTSCLVIFVQETICPVIFLNICALTTLEEQLFSDILSFFSNIVMFEALIHV
jgi:hypothetical protein